MSDHITVKLTAHDEVLNALINRNGEIDFNQIVPIPPLKLKGQNIHGQASNLARLVFEKNPWTDELTADQLGPKAFVQFTSMLENKRKYGYYHHLECQTEMWGTKWNAYDQTIEPGVLIFNTANNSPDPVLIQLSKRFPDEVLHITITDHGDVETISIKNGKRS